MSPGSLSSVAAFSSTLSPVLLRSIQLPVEHIHLGTSKQCHLWLSLLLFLCSSDSKWNQHPLALLSQELSPSPHPAFPSSLSFLFQVHSDISLDPWTSSVSRKKPPWFVAFFQFHSVTTVSLKLPKWCLKWCWEEIHVIGSTALIHQFTTVLSTWNTCIHPIGAESVSSALGNLPESALAPMSSCGGFLLCTPPTPSPTVSSSRAALSTALSTEYTSAVCIYWMNTRTRDLNPSLRSDLPPRQCLESKLLTILLWIFTVFLTEYWVDGIAFTFSP